MLFSIKNLYCGYGENDVLYINNFDLEKGKITFLLGKSGIGKSTFLETIGLMNNTMNASSHSTLDFHHKGKSIDLTNIWSSSDEEISKFRAQHFGFIFQSTNLLANLSVGENIAITSMLSNEHTHELRAKIEEALVEIGMPKEFYDKKVFRLSGGQKQRVAFLRAIFSKYDVLFCDEPTGNLDDMTAHKLFSILSSKILTDHKSCLVVSHDISLALQFADRIQMIVAKRILPTDAPIGNLSSHHSIIKRDESWVEELTKKEIKDPRAWIDEKLNLAS